MTYSERWALNMVYSGNPSWGAEYSCWSTLSMVCSDHPAWARRRGGRAPGACPSTLGLGLLEYEVYTYSHYNTMAMVSIAISPMII